MKLTFVDTTIDAILNGTGATDLVTDIANQVKARAVSTAPVVTGGYRDSLQVVVEHSGRRVRAEVQSTVPYAMSVETNHGTLQTALDAAGGS